jgi:hypothetical protein
VESSEARQIDLDIGRTFPHIEGFDEDGLGRILKAYSALRADVGYCQGMNFVAALLLVVLEREEAAFHAFARLMDDYDLAGFYRKSFPLMRRYVLATDRLLLFEAPLIRTHFEKEGIQPYLYLHEWFLSLFVDCMPPVVVLDIFDAIMDKGLLIVVPIVVAIMSKFQEKLLSMKFEDIFKFLKGMKNGGRARTMALRAAVEDACGQKLPDEIMEYLEGKSDELAAEIPGEMDGLAETDTSGSRWLRAVSRTISSLSPKKRRGQKVTEKPSQKPHLGDLSPPPSLHAVSDRSPPSASTLRCAAMQTPSDNDVLDVASPSRQSARRRSFANSSPSLHEEGPAWPMRLSFDIEELPSVGANVPRRSSRIHCCGSQQVSSPTPGLACSPKRHGCSSSPTKMSCSNSPVKRSGYQMRARQ